MGKVNEIYGTADEIAYADTDSAIAPAAIEPNTPTTSGKTPNYGLPQWAGSDITDWFELNPAFEKIDEVMHANAEAVATSQNTGDSNTTAISNLTQSLNNTISRVTDAENVNTQQGQQITLNVTHLNEHDTAIQTLQTTQAAMNETLEDVSGEAATSTADITDIKQRLQVAEENISQNADNIGDMSSLHTTTKTSLVSAVNEVLDKTPAAGGGSCWALSGVANSQLSAVDSVKGQINMPNSIFSVEGAQGGYVNIQPRAVLHAVNISGNINVTGTEPDVNTILSIAPAAAVFDVTIIASATVALSTSTGTVNKKITAMQEYKNIPRTNLSTVVKNNVIVVESYHYAITALSDSQMTEASKPIVNMSNTIEPQGVVLVSARIPSNN